ncbi:MAG: DUF72 domain-containing protein [Bryobacteraceae bacterium]
METLFDEPGAFERDRLAAAVRRLAANRIYIGASSWKYEGWLGQVYSRSRYLARGRFSPRVFEQHCLAEYAETFPTVCGDFSFYQFPSGDYWRRLFAQVPSGFRFAFKVPEQITCKVFPAHARYGSQAGAENEAFLDAAAFREMFARPLLPYVDKTALLIFEFGAFSKKSFEEPAQFLERLAPFLGELPPEFLYAVEVRNPEYLCPDYFGLLRGRGVAHVYNAWTRMPDLKAQIAIPESVTAEHVVCRALLRRGRSYEEAVAKFAPYREVRDPNPGARDAMRILINRAREKNHVAFLFVNNRLEGNAPQTILAVAD